MTKGHPNTCDMMARCPVVALAQLFTLLSKRPGGTRGITVYAGPAWRAVALSRGAVAAGSVLAVAAVLALVAVLARRAGLAAVGPDVAGGAGARAVHRVTEGSVSAGADLRTAGAIFIDGARSVAMTAIISGLTDTLPCPWMTPADRSSVNNRTNPKL